jgi:hypothetical protein
LHVRRTSPCRCYHHSDTRADRIQTCVDWQHSRKSSATRAVLGSRSPVTSARARETSNRASKTSSRITAVKAALTGGIAIVVALIAAIVALSPGPLLLGTVGRSACRGENGGIALVPPSCRPRQRIVISRAISHANKGRSRQIPDRCLACAGIEEQVIGLAIAIKVRHTNYSPTSRKSGSVGAGDKSIVVQVPDRRACRPRYFYLKREVLVRSGSPRPFVGARCYA